MSLPLTPPQRRFFGLGLEAPDHWCQAQLLEVRTPLPLGRLAAIVAALLRQHEPLRHRFRQRGDGSIEVTAGGLPNPLPVHGIDLSRLAPQAARGAVRQISNRLLGSLHLGGALVRVALFNLPPPSPERLLVVLHHLVSDRPSWQILFADFLSARAQLERGERVCLPAATSPAAAWTDWLEGERRANLSPGEAAFWRGNEAPSPPLPRDLEAGPNHERSAARLHLALPLRQVLPRAWRANGAGAGLLPLTLTAFLRAIAAWSGSPRLKVDLRASGRFNLPPGLDLSRTLGWFTHSFPLVLEVRAGEPFAATWERVQAALGRAGNGAGFSGTSHSAELSFNFLGHSPVPALGAPLVPLGVELGPLRGPENNRPYLFEVTSQVVADTFLLDWEHSRNLHREETARALAEVMLEELGRGARAVPPPRENGRSEDMASARWQTLRQAARDLTRRLIEDPWTYRRDRVLLRETRLEGFTHAMASRQGLYAINQTRWVKIAEGQFFGLTLRGGKLFAFQANDRLTSSSHRGRILRFTLAGGRVQHAEVMAKGFDNGCHQMDWIGDRLYLLDTYNNAVLRLAPDFVVEETLYPVGPAPFNAWEEGYAHFNSILWHRGEIFLLRHNGTPKTGRPSELVRCDESLWVLESRPVPGGGCHNIAFLEDGTCLICDSQGGALITPEAEVLKVDQMWTRGLAIGESEIVVGSSIYGAERKKRRNLPGKVYFFDRAYQLLAALEVPAAPTDIRRLDGKDLGLSSRQQALVFEADAVKQAGRGP